MRAVVTNFEVHGPVGDDTFATCLARESLQHGENE